MFSSTHSLTGHIIQWAFNFLLTCRLMDLDLRIPQYGYSFEYIVYHILFMIELCYLTIGLGYRIQHKKARPYEHSILLCNILSISLICYYFYHYTEFVYFCMFVSVCILLVIRKYVKLIFYFIGICMTAIGISCMFILITLCIITIPFQFYSHLFK